MALVLARVDVKAGLGMGAVPGVGPGVGPGVNPGAATRALASGVVLDVTPGVVA